MDGDKQLGTSFIASVEHLTENYFKLDDEHRLAELVRLIYEGYELSYIVISKLASYSDRAMSLRCITPFLMIFTFRIEQYNFYKNLKVLVE